MQAKTETFFSTLKERTRLSKPASVKSTYHLSLELPKLDFSYVPGDCIGIHPVNHPGLIEEILSLMGLTGNEEVTHRKFGILSFRELLTNKASLTQITKPILKAFTEALPPSEEKEELSKVLLPENRELFLAYIQGKDLRDLMEAHPSIRLTLEKWVKLLPPLLPRLYSIASSSCLNPQEVHLTIRSLEYQTHQKTRFGVCSDFLCKRSQKSDRLLCYFQRTKDFLLPENPLTPIIMIGPGTGIAPFRAFLQERQAKKHAGKNWLFFGECQKENDFYYQDFLETLENDGKLKLSTAFSRDQKEKVYVQHKLLAHKEELWQWINKENASIYLCGDATHMAKDVENALTTIISESLGDEQALHYLEELKSNKRYLKDVY